LEYSDPAYRHKLNKKKSITMMLNLRRLILVTIVGTLTVPSSVAAQQYDTYDQDYGQDYTQDSLYHDYAMKQQQKDASKT
jgi:hypothetical protein